MIARKKLFHGLNKTCNNNNDNNNNNLEIYITQFSWQDDQLRIKAMHKIKWLNNKEKLRQEK